MAHFYGILANGLSKGTSAHLYGGVESGLALNLHDGAGHEWDIH
jgi:hypothetical protein